MVKNEGTCQKIELTFNNEPSTAKKKQTVENSFS